MAFRSSDQQLSFLDGPKIDAAVAGMAAGGVESRGAIFTRREVVEFILDLAGYTTDKPLHRARILEPSMGHGDFLLPAIDRLFESYLRESGVRKDIVKDLGNCLVAVELHRGRYDESRRLVMAALGAKGLNPSDSAALCESPRTAAKTSEYADLSELTSLKTFVTSFAGHIAAEAAR